MHQFSGLFFVTIIFSCITVAVLKGKDASENETERILKKKPVDGMLSAETVKQLEENQSSEFQDQG